MKGKFKPTKKMKALLKAMANPEIKPTITAHCKEADIARSTYYDWMEDDEFVAWFDKEWKTAMVRMGSWLDKVGLMKSTKDFRYWEAMQMKYQGFSQQSEQKVDAGNPVRKINIHVINEHEELKGSKDKKDSDEQKE